MARPINKRNTKHLTSNDDGTINIGLSCGGLCVVDREDLDIVSEYPWYRSRTSNQVYTKNSKQGLVSMSRLIMGVTDDLSVLVDHKDRDPLNNTRKNLRLCTSSQNNCNKRALAKSSSVYKGVSIDKVNNKWRSQITLYGKNYNLGRFDCEIEAAKAYDAKAKELHGEFAYLNFPDK